MELTRRADVSWNGIHRDARNSDATGYEVGAYLTPAWTALEGAAILFGPAIGPENRRYVTTGRGGGLRNLHAFEPDGTPFLADHPDWKKPGPRICTDVPLFDSDGRMFVSGEEHVWCFGPDGNLTWVTNIAQHRAVGGFVSTIITRAGYVGGVTLHGQMVLLDPETGVFAKPLHQTPAGPVFEPVPAMPGLWHDGLMDQHLVNRIEPAFFGRGFSVTSSAAVNPTSGLIYYAAVSPSPGRSRLYAVSENAPEITIEFETDIDGICTASPSISPDGQRVYTVNGKGLLHAFDARSGALIWKRAGGNMAASPAVGLDDIVYSAGINPEDGRSCLMAVKGESGDLVWERNYDEIAGASLPVLQTSELFPVGAPTAVANSVPTITPNVIFMLVNLGYAFREPSSGRMMHQPHIPCLLSIDPSNGSVISRIDVRDTSEAVIVAGDDGMVHVCHAALMSSVFHFGINPHLPKAFRSPLKPVGGFSTFKAAKA
ncbi:MAG: PQQ-binding-like beta-propeller repeat protein [Henriciella sp.]|uniref:outer membrane protein assembly factor BamB family protein n=1 Tax=Henriciella sp. TaxID=1968823 RepID=UPI0032EF2056